MKPPKLTRRAVNVFEALRLQGIDPAVDIQITAKVLVQEKDARLPHQVRAVLLKKTAMLQSAKGMLIHATATFDGDKLLHVIFTRPSPTQLETHKTQIRIAKAEAFAALSQGETADESAARSGAEARAAAAKESVSEDAAEDAAEDATQ